MSYARNSGYGYGGMPMPMAYGQQQPSTPYSVSSVNTPYPSSSPAPYPTAVQSQHQNMVNNNEIDMWMDQLIANLTSLIKDATTSELENLVTNEDKLIELVQDADQTKKLLRKREELVTSNKDQAVTNMSLEPELDLLKKNIVVLAREQNDLKEKHMQLQQRLAGKVSLDSMLAVLQAAAAEKESESDKLSEEFVEGRKSIDEFVDIFIPERKIYQLRKVKSEKMTQLLRTGAITINRVPSLSNTVRPIPVPRRDVLTGYGGYGGY